MKFKWDVFNSNIDTLVSEKYKGNQTEFNDAMVDRSQNDIDQIIDNKIYAFREGNQIRIKRLAWENGKIKVTADNVERPYDADMNIFVLKGRIIWLGRDVE